MKTRRGISGLGLLIVLGMLALTWTQVMAQTPVSVTDDDVNRVASQLYCPVCENVTLDVCPTEACTRWRDLIRSKLALGWTDQQVTDLFVTQFGARVTGIPPRSGISSLLYILPPAAALLLLGGGFLIVKKYRTPNPLTAQPVKEGIEHSDRLRKRLSDDIDKELKR